MDLMRIASYIGFVIALCFYVKWIQAIWKLVAESKPLESAVRFNRFNWTPALKVHRGGYPDSPLRRQIVTYFLLTSVIMIAAMACLAYSTFHPSVIR